MPLRAVRLVVCALALWASSPPAAAAQLTVAAASDLQPVMPEVAARFQRATGERVRIVYGSSGQFVSQIEQGAPFDVYLAADDAYVARLVASGHADGVTATVYATARLALWSRTDSGVDPANGLRALLSPAVRRIAIANPEHAPYGRAAIDALRRAGLYDAVKGRLVLGENVSQAAQFAESGNADAALIALSLTLTPAMRQAGRALEIASSAFTPIRQTGVVVARSTSKAAGRRFLAFLRQPETAALLQASGFGTPP